MANQGGEQQVSREEINRIVDQRLAQVLGINSEELEEFQPEEAVLATPSVLSIVRTTAYVHC